MASNYRVWTWDPQRGEYYYFSAQESSWIYQSGRRVHTNEAGGASSSKPTASLLHEPSPKIKSKGANDPIEDLDDSKNEVEDEDTDLARGTKSLLLSKYGGYITEPKEDITDPELLKVGLGAKGLLTGNY